MSISAVSALSASASAVSTNSAKASATVDYNQYLNLLVTQLKNQDPTSPTDPTQYMSQLASFSAVEQQIKTNSSLDSLIATQAGTLIGRTATSADGSISGIIVAVTTGEGGAAVATLANGSKIALGSGVTISIA
ncbi:flagellar hook assembly protein FlgD [Methylocella sp.]|uniref:flagellar hook assembly protein FlgD n=1 Tax=Methylocella sp. TaxID=1978226 RepID=UPI0035AEC1DC